MAGGDLIAGMEIFRSLPPAAQSRLAALARPEEYPAGSTLFREGAPATTLYILVHGMVAIRTDTAHRGDILVETLRQPGQLFGWSAALRRPTYVYTARALEDTRVLAISAAELHDYIESDPTAAYHIMRVVALVVAERLENTRAQLTNLLEASPITHG